MARVRLTENYLRKIPAGKERHWDTHAPGLYALGGAKGVTFYCKSAIGEHKIGKAADWTLDEARSRARELRHAADKGIDLRLLPERPPALPTLREAFEMFADGRLVKRSPRTAIEYRQQLQRHVFKQWGNRPIDELTRAEVSALHRKITKAGRPVRANRLMSTISSLYGWLRREHYPRLENPAASIERNSEEPRSVVLTVEQVGALQEALEAYPGPGSAADALLFLIATGARRNEVRAMRWSEIDPSLSVWTKPSSHTKQKREHRLLIGEVAQRVLLKRRGLRDRDDMLVFPPVGPGKLVSLRAAWEFATAKIGLPDLRVHDLRHVHAGLLASSGIPLRTIGQLLGHAHTATTQRYAGLLDSHLREAVGTVNALLDRRRKDSE
jgi:integrase